MIYTLLNKVEFDAFPTIIKKQIVSISTSTDYNSFSKTTLSAVEYYIIAAKMEFALLTPLKNYEMFNVAEVKKIISSGVYIPASSKNTFDSEGKQIVRSSAIAEDDNRRVRHTGIMDKTFSVTGDVDWQMDQLTYQGQNVASIFVGVKYKIVGGNDGDSLDFCVIDIDNILGYGANFVLDAFAKNYYVFPNEIETVREYKADMFPGLYIRAHYTKTGPTDARFICNLLRYVVTP